MEQRERIDAKLRGLAQAPGVYVFRGAGGDVLYVGKAVNLRSRVRSYFQQHSSDERYLIPRLVSEVHDFETYVVSTEKEAVLLERQLIKEHNPRYNIRLTDDKSYLSLRIDPRMAWPRVDLVRRPRADGAQYFGPYHSARAARRTLDIIGRTFKLRTCSDYDFKTRTRPCIQYQIKRCPAPCVYPVDKDVYAEQVRGAMLFLEGRRSTLRRELGERMKQAAQGARYEEAALYRDQLQALESVAEPQIVARVDDRDIDVFGLFREGQAAELAVLCLREGEIAAVRTFGVKRVEVPAGDVLADALREFYTASRTIPDEVVLPIELEAADGVAELLSEQRGTSVRLVVPKRGRKRELVDLAMKNAEHAFHEKAQTQAGQDAVLQQLQRALRLERPPQRIECVDISHFAGAATVGSLVVFIDGAPAKQLYRSFNVREAEPGDDYAAMREVLSRRLKRAGDESWDLPDLLVVDGGRGQLNVAMSVLEDLGLERVPLAALAKERINQAGEELHDRLFIPGRKNALALKPGSAALNVLVQLRDEAHRFSNAARERRQHRALTESELESIPGVGRTTARTLIQHFGSIDAILSADVDELVRAGCTRPQALAISGRVQSS